LGKGGDLIASDSSSVCPHNDHLLSHGLIAVPPCEQGACQIHVVAITNENLNEIHLRPGSVLQAYAVELIDSHQGCLQGLSREGGNKGN
jgi:hypothetical protein